MAAEYDDEGTLVVDQYFAIVPEWLIDADISDAAYRLYSVLLRYGQSSGTRMPGRALLARRLRKRSTDSVDRALKELVAVGAVVVERRRRGREYLSNQYHLRSTPPKRSPAPATPPVDPRSSVQDSMSERAPGADDRGGGRRSAATPNRTPDGRTDAATPGRTDAATLAADLRPYPGVLTQEEPPPPTPSASPERWRTTLEGGGGPARSRSGATGSGGGALLRRPARGARRDAHLARREQLIAAVGLDTLDGVVEQCRSLRRGLGLPVARWTASTLGDVLAVAVFDRGWPAAGAVPALLIVAADRQTRSPARLSCAGPWWDDAEAASRTEPALAADADELARLEARLAEADGVRIRVQRLAREQLSTSGEPVTRLAVARTACRLSSAEASGEGVA